VGTVACCCCGNLWVLGLLVLSLGSLLYSIGLSWAIPLGCVRLSWGSPNTILGLAWAAQKSLLWLLWVQWPVAAGAAVATEGLWNLCVAGISGTASWGSLVIIICSGLSSCAPPSPGVYLVFLGLFVRLSLSRFLSGLAGASGKAGKGVEPLIII
jgi:hypothetical protein